MFFLFTLFVVSSISLSIFSPSPVLGLTTMNSSDESTRETLKPWSDRWTNKRIGFHLKEVNPVLLNHASALLPTQDGETCDAAKTKILVPLCGKAIDMAYLATSLSSTGSIEVVGLEGIHIALEEFIDEHPDLKISKEAVEGTSEVPFERFMGDSVSLWKGDYFDLLEPSEELKSSIGTFEAIYDRASIVAIEPEMREKYVRILDSLLMVGGKILLVALERVASPEKEFATKIGPPFSIPEDTIRTLFANVVGDSGEYSYHVEILQQTDQLVEKPEDRQRYADLEKLLETVYLIRKQGN